MSETHKVLAEAAENLAFGSDIKQITAIVANAARKLCGADGATFVLRDEGMCHYVDENAISPLWKGKRFPMEACISGWSMIHGKIALIPDIYQDQRIPHDAYRPTFVKSLCMVPIRPASPLGAIGNYWAKEYRPSQEEVKMLQALANCAAVAVENWELRRAVEKRRLIEKHLKQKRDELETAIHGLAHDLRSPISSILSFAELLRTHLSENLDERAQRYLESIFTIAMHSNNAIGQMLALYKLTSRELQKQEVDLTIIGLELEAQIRAQNAQRKIQFQIDDEMSACGDPVLIRLVIENLFANAVKFTKKNTETLIHFGAQNTANGSKQFYVRDNGVGFDPRDVGKLFRPQVRLHGENEFQGTGLGLANVARIIEVHSGTVRAEGRKGEGATFFFSLPSQP